MHAKGAANVSRKAGRGSKEGWNKRGSKISDGKLSDGKAKSPAKKPKVSRPIEKSRETPKRRSEAKAKARTTKTEAPKRRRKLPADISERQKPTRQLASHKFTVIPLSAKTYKPLKRTPKTGDQVVIGIKDKRGKVTLVQSRFSQAFSKQDFAQFQKIIDRTGKKNFVLYEELTKSKYKDPETGQIKFAEKLTFGKPGRKQRPVLFTDGRRTRELDLGFREHGKREMVDTSLMHVLKPDGEFSKEIFLQGATIKETISNLPLQLSMAQIKSAKLNGLHFQCVVSVKGHDPIVVHGKTEVYANFATDVARQIRYALANRGLRFTSLTTLQELAYEAEEEGDDAMADMLMHVGRGSIPVESLKPIFREYEGRDMRKRSGSDLVSVSIQVSGMR